MNLKAVMCSIPLAFAVAFGMTWLCGPPSAQGQKPAANPRWEYKIVNLTDADLALHTAQETFSTLAGNGWEFVETITSRPPQSLGGLNSTTCVLFRRDAR